ncbi:MAG: bifunctional diaminohydroxyphosphoribosylaminopyrimidine deaminase/5-amino-6-(5-phosphoribosylamino)uracil reductase RibD [Deltaproteobacteria bacterium]|nr:bifunctional diaminohydroxyphosphoribosylaminopyrimidine deaminase/5-amino-6-(5-phosphoribosylamino)uracil reductase RibD [Deltaproteobacteria bacterium]
MKTADEKFMERALRLAGRGWWRVSPNPMVGAVIVKEGRIIGEGYHHAYGKEHAEVVALNNATASPAGACLYVTLEPCCHHGKTPPCTSAIIQSGIKRVVIASHDPNPLISGKGISILEAAGIQTTVGVLIEEARRCNASFFKFMEKGLPFVTLKIAQSLDGKIATKSGDSFWITSLASRRHAHRLRSANDAILVGIGTVKSDDPLLTCRLVKGRNPLRVVLDSRLTISEDAKVLKGDAKTLLLVTRQGANEQKMAVLRTCGAEVLELPAVSSGIDLGCLLRELGNRGVSSVLVEGGSSIATSFLQGGFVDKIALFVAPKIIGDGIPIFGDLGVSKITESIGIDWLTQRRFGRDLFFEGLPLQRHNEA